jgi:hypothetical protein
MDSPRAPSYNLRGPILWDRVRADARPTPPAPCPYERGGWTRLRRYIEESRRIRRNGLYSADHIDITTHNTKIR